MQNIRFICAQPANSYYTWQVEVVINNFIKNGVNPNQIDILCAINNDNVPEDWKVVWRHESTKSIRNKDKVQEATVEVVMTPA